MKKLIYILLTLLLSFSSCFRTDQSDPPYSEKKVKSLIEKKYDLKGQLEFVKAEKLRKPPLAKNKYTYQNKETGVQFWAIAQVSVPPGNGFFPFITDIFGYDRTYSDSYESYLMLQKKEKALALAKKLDVHLIMTDTLVNNVFDKIYLRDSGDIESASKLIFNLYELYQFPQKDYTDIDACVVLYKAIDDTIKPKQFCSIEYRRFTKEYAEEHPTLALSTEEELAWHIKNSYRW